MLKLSLKRICSLASGTAVAAGLTLSGYAHAEDTASPGGDPVVLGHLVVINENEIAAASVAQQKELSEQGQQIVDMIHKDHTANLDQTHKIAGQLGQKPHEDALAKEKRAHAKQQLDAIKDKDGQEFETAFITMMVEGHRDALNTIDNHCLKVAESEALRNHLTKTREAVARHLEHCEMAQGEGRGEHGADAAKHKKAHGDMKDKKAPATDNTGTGASDREAARGGTGGGQAPGANVSEEGKANIDRAAGDN
jgi:putative membrane protein